MGPKGWGKVLLGEVRFPAIIEEDEAPLYLLGGDYPATTSVN